MPRHKKEKNCMKIFSVSLKDCLKLFEEVNEWLDTPANLDYNTVTFNVPMIIFKKIDDMCSNRSAFIKEKLRDFLDLLKERLGEPEAFFPSRSEFVRNALLFHYLRMKCNMKSIDHLKQYLENNGLKILREA
jgi:Arc/MetJ-type ribon-helix-helix transcriptional regulator